VTTPQNPLFDLGNQLLAQVPSRLDTGSVTTPAGKTGVLTFRNASTTLTLFVAVEDLRNWAALMNDLAAELGGGLTVASAADVAALSAAELRNGKRP